MWKSYHTLRISDAFVKLWHNFLDFATLEKQPIFFQHGSDMVLQQLITKQFTVTQAAVSPAPLRSQRISICARYLCQNVKKKILKPQSMCIRKFFSCACDKDEDVSNSADWVHAVNRGGLCLVSETMLFHEIEFLVRKVFQGETEIATNLHASMKECAV